MVRAPPPGRAGENEQIYITPAAACLSQVAERRWRAVHHPLSRAGSSLSARSAMRLVAILVTAWCGVGAIAAGCKAGATSTDDSGAATGGTTGTGGGAGGTGGGGTTGAGGAGSGGSPGLGGSANGSG